MSLELERADHALTVAEQVLEAIVGRIPAEVLTFRDDDQINIYLSVRVAKAAQALLELLKRSRH